jgi:hypothetical protein
MKLTFNKQAAKIFKSEQNTDGLQELSSSFLEYRAKKEKYRERMKKYEKKEEVAEETLYRQMLQLKVSSFKRKADGVLLSTSDKKHYFVNQERREDFLKLLKKIGEAEIIKTDVGWQALQALMGKIDGNIKSEIANIRVKNKRLRRCLMEVLKFTERISIRVTGVKRRQDET